MPSNSQSPHLPTALSSDLAHEAPSYRRSCPLPVVSYFLFLKVVWILSIVVVFDSKCTIEAVFVHGSVDWFSLFVDCFLRVNTECCFRICMELTGGLCISFFALALLLIDESEGPYIAMGERLIFTSTTVRCLIVVIGYLLQSMFLMLMDQCDWLF